MKLDKQKTPSECCEEVSRSPLISSSSGQIFNLPEPELAPVSRITERLLRFHRAGHSTALDKKEVMSNNNNRKDNRQKCGDCQ